MSFSKIFQILFIVGSIFLIVIPECLNNSWWYFSSSFSTFEDRRRVSLKSWSVLSKILVLAWCHPLIIVLDCENSFHPSGAIQESFQFDSPEPIISELLIPAFSSRCPNLIGASCKYSLVSSWSLHSLVSKFPQVSTSFSNSSRCFFIFSSFIFQFLRWFVQDFSSLVIISIHLLFQSYRRIVEDFSQVCAISILILSTRISSMPNPLLVINLNWWRIRVM